MPTRRDFLAGAGAAAISVALARSGFAEDSAGDKKLGYAFVGIGSLTKNQLLPGIAKCKYSKVVALVTGHPEQNAALAEKLGIKPSSVYTYDNYDDIAKNPEIDVVYNVLPNGMHAEYTIRAFKAGKHVLCEKPMASNSAECQQMIDAGKSAGKKLMIAYRVRREPHNMKAIEVCHSGQFGKPRFINTEHGFRMGDPTVWRLNKKLAGGGALYDIGIYSLNAARYLSGEEPVSVTAQQIDNPSDPRFKEVEEGMVWTMKFPSGLLATLSTSYNMAGTNRYRVIFEKGVLDAEPATAYHGNKFAWGSTRFSRWNCPISISSPRRWIIFPIASSTTKNRSPPARRVCKISRSSKRFTKPPARERR